MLCIDTMRSPIYTRPTLASTFRIPIARSNLCRLVEGHITTMFRFHDPWESDHATKSLYMNVDIVCCCVSRRLDVVVGFFSSLNIWVDGEFNYVSIILNNFNKYSSHFIYFYSILFWFSVDLSVLLGPYHNKGWSSPMCGTMVQPPCRSRILIFWFFFLYHSGIHNEDFTFCLFVTSRVWIFGSIFVFKYHLGHYIMEESSYPRKIIMVSFWYTKIFFHRD